MAGMWGLVVGLAVWCLPPAEGLFRGVFPCFFFVWGLGGFWARALQKLSLGPKPRARAVSTATNVYRKKNRHSESVPRIHALFLKVQHADEVRGMARKNGQLYPPRGPIGCF